MGTREEDEEKARKAKGLGLKDYVAIMIAALTTFLLPLVILVIVLGVLVLAFALRP